MSVNNAYKLISDIDKKFATWNERSQFKLKGVGNLSVSDLDTLKMYAESYISSGGYGFNGLMDPFGEIKEVLSKYGIESNDCW